MAEDEDDDLDDTFNPLITLMTNDSYRFFIRMEKRSLGGLVDYMPLSSGRL